MNSNETYITADQLCVGIYVQLDVPWMNHSFPFSSFLIKSPSQIAKIRDLGLARIRIDPSKCTAQPLAPASKPEAPIEVPQHCVDTLAQQKQQRAVQLKRLNAEIAAVERQFKHAAEVIRAITRTIHSDPAQVHADTSALISSMVEGMLSKPDVVLHAMSDQLGEDTYFHSLNVTVLAMLLGRALGLTATELHQLGIGAVFHDIGKTSIPKVVELKQEPLNRAEQAAYEQHAMLGLGIAQKLKLPEAAQQIVAQHHENADGSGYPNKLSGDAISLLASIVGIANVYDNLCNPLNAANALTPHEALAKMFSSMRSRFDQARLKMFIKCLGVYPPGSIVQLSNERIGLVVSGSSDKPLKPDVLVYDKAVPKDEPLIVNLASESDVVITKSIRPTHLPREVHQYLNPRKRVTYYFDPKRQGAS